MSACLEVWFEKSCQARAPREPLGHSRSLGHRRKGQSNRERRGGVTGGTGGVRERGEARMGEKGEQGTEGKGGAGRENEENTAEQGEELGGRKRWKTGQRRQEQDGKKGGNRAKQRRGAA